MLFSIQTSNPSLADMFINTSSFPNSKLSPAKSTDTFSPDSNLGTTSLAFNFPNAPANIPIFLPKTGPKALKFGFKLKFMYSLKSAANTTSLTLSSSFIKSTTSLILASYFPSTNTFWIG